MKHRKGHKKKPASQMSDKELSRAYERRSIMFSWVAFLDDSKKDVIARYMADAHDGIMEVENEMIARNIQEKCN